MIEIINEIGERSSEREYLTETMNFVASHYQGDLSLVATCFFGDNYSRKMELPKTKFKKVAFVTCDEWSQIPPYMDDPDLLMMFKTCHLLARKHPKIFPIPLGRYNGFNPGRLKPINERQYDLSFNGQVRSPDRVHMRDVINAYVAKTKRSNFLRFTSSYADGDVQSYSSIMAETKICLNPSPGNVTVDSTRFFEGLSTGCVVLSTPRPYTWFYNGAPYIPIHSWTDAPFIIDDILSNPSQMLEISMASLEWWRNVCSPEMVGSYVCEKIHGGWK